MILEFKLGNPSIEIMPTRSGHIYLNIENVPGLTNDIIDEITSKLGFEAIFKAFDINNLLELQTELEQYIKEMTEDE